MLSRGLVLCALALAACGGPGDRQPSAAEVAAYTAGIERNAAAAKAGDIRASRAREQRRDDLHARRMAALDQRQAEGTRPQ